MAEKTKRNHVFLVGVERAGTTWCWNVLLENSSVSVCNPKEPDYFSQNYKLGPDWYAKHFLKEEDTEVSVDISPTYFYSEGCAGRIKNDYPDAKIVFVLRNPFDRAISHAQFHERGFRARKTKMVNMVSGNRIFIEHSLYFNHVTEYLNLFGKAAVQALWYEDLQKNPKDFAKKLQEAVGVEPISFQNKFNAHVNSAIPSPFMRLGLFNLMRRLYRFLNKTPLLHNLLFALEQKSKLKYRVLQLFRSNKSSKSTVFSDLFTDHDKQTIDRDLKSLHSIFPSRVDGWLSASLD